MEIHYPLDIYRDTRDRAVHLFRGCSAEQAATIVPLNPAWTVANVAAHVCGIVDDVLNGNTEGLGTDAWTQAQVDKRADHSLSQICDEWEGLAGQIDAMTAENTFFGIRLTGDLILHLQDVQHALHVKIDRADTATKLAAHRYVPTLQERALEQLDLGVAVQLTDGQAYQPSVDASDLSRRDAACSRSTG